MSSIRTRSPRRRISAGWFGVILLFSLAVAGVAYGNHRFAPPDLTRTPSPGPYASSRLIQLYNGQTLGVGSLPHSTARGGLGQTVDGIECASQEYAGIHVHAHLALFVDGKQLAVPKDVGVPAEGKRTSCTYWIHTHDASGIIHVEAPATAGFTLGEFFDIWGEPLDRSQLASFSGAVRAYVNGSPYSGDLRAILLSSHQDITLEVGTPIESVPRYAFPPNV